MILKQNLSYCRTFFVKLPPSVRDEYFNIVSKQSSDYYIGVDFIELHLVPNYSLLVVILDMFLIMIFIILDQCYLLFYTLEIIHGIHSLYPVLTWVTLFS
jgi:hypothetical protein